MIRFYTLGSLALKGHDGRQLRSVLAQPKRVALLAYLAACGERETHRRDTLLGVFWPEMDEARARRALNQALYVLRRAVGPSVFVTTGDEELCLDPGELWCDSAAFMEAVEAGRSEDALEHYRGDLLEGFFISDAPEFEKWLDAERAKLRRLAAQAAWTLADAEESAGREDAAAEWARRAAGYSLENEGVLRRLISLLDRVGDRAAAVRAYEEFAARLRHELGVDPSPESQQLITAIRARETLPPGSAGPASGQASARAPEIAAPALAQAPPSSASPKERVEIWDAMEADLDAGVSEAERATGSGATSVAVLPFADLSAGGDQEYFSDGVAEELIAALAKVQGLRVAARTSSFRFKETSEDVRTIGELLNVGAVLEGSVRSEGDRVRITVQLVDATDGFQIWSDVYDRELADIFAVQEEIARTIVDRLRVELLGEIQPTLVRGHTEDLNAYTLYLKGRYLWNTRTAGGLRESVSLFEQAIAADEEYAQAHAGLADAYSLLGWYRHISAEEAYSRIKLSAERALELEDSVPEACTSYAYAKFLYEWDFTGAEMEFRRAIDLNPDYPTVHHWYGEFLMAMDRREEAHEELERAHLLDPLSLTITVGLGWAEYFLGRYERAIERYESVLGMDPGFAIVPWFLGPAYVQSRRFDDAIDLYEEWVARLDRHPGMVACLAQAHALAGRTDEARSVYEELEAQAERAPIFPDYHALVHTALGDADAAFGWLEKALEERCWVLVFLGVDPAYESLRTDPRFPALLQRIGLTTGG
ncbi:MAG: tetratricopeptide repeat protein [Gemmatimonadota bacterium]